MIKSIEISHTYGQYNHLNMILESPELSEGYAVLEIKGLTPGKATINTVDWAILDGSTTTVIKLPKRSIDISLRFLPQEGQTIESMREMSYRYFPIKKKVRLAIRKTNGEGYFIDGYVEKNDPVIWSKEEGNDITILCPNPYFKDTQAVEYNYMEVINHWHFESFTYMPVTPVGNENPSAEGWFEYITTDAGNIYEPTTDEDVNPNKTYYIVDPDSFIEVPDDSITTGFKNDEYETSGSVLKHPIFPLSEIYIQKEKMIYNESDTDVGIEMKLQALSAGVKNPYVYCATTHETFKLIYDMAEDEEITIVTRDGEHTVESSIRGSILQYIDLSRNDWIKLYPGYNKILIGADKNTDSMNLIAKVRPIYAGI